MMVRRFGVIGVLAAMLAGCAPIEPPVNAPEAGFSPLATDQAKPGLALMDHVLAEYFASDISARPTICASVTGEETLAFRPEQELALIERYDQLAPFERCHWTGSGYVDSLTKQQAMVFNVHSLDCTSESECSGWAGYMAGNTSSLHARYTMHYASGAWTFERDARVIAD